MARTLLLTLVVVVASLPIQAGADDLTAIIQTDLQTLGYAPGTTDGEMTVQTAVAVSKFQAENGLEVTGEVSPQLAGVIKAAISKQGQAAPAAQSAPAIKAGAQQGAAMQAAQMQQVQGAAGIDPAAMQAMSQAGMDPAALQAMMAQMQGSGAMDPAMLQAMQAQGAQAQTAEQACLQKKIAEAQAAKEAAQKKRGFGSLMRAVSRLGGDDVAASVASATTDIANANAAISDLESAARDLGLTEADVESCRNP